MGRGQRFRRMVYVGGGGGAGDVVRGVGHEPVPRALGLSVAPGRFGPPLRQTPNASLENGLAIFCNEQTTVGG